MKTAPNFMTHPLVLQALAHLQVALEKVLQDADNDLKSVAVLIVPDQGLNGALQMGCDFDGCKAALLRGANIILAPGDTDRPIGTAFNPITMVH